MRARNSSLLSTVMFGTLAAGELDGPSAAEEDGLAASLSCLGKVWKLTTTGTSAANASLVENDVSPPIDTSSTSPSSVRKPMMGSSISLVVTFVNPDFLNWETTSWYLLLLTSEAFSGA